jgi:hypothetical protein
MTTKIEVCPVYGNHGTYKAHRVQLPDVTDSHPLLVLHDSDGRQTSMAMVYSMCPDGYRSNRLRANGVLVNHAADDTGGQALRRYFKDQGFVWPPRTDP